VGQVIVFRDTIFSEGLSSILQSSSSTCQDGTLSVFQKSYADGSLCIFIWSRFVAKLYLSCVFLHTVIYNLHRLGGEAD